MTRVDFVLATLRSLFMLKPVNSIDNAKPNCVFTEQRGLGAVWFPLYVCRSSLCSTCTEYSRSVSTGSDLKPQFHPPNSSSSAVMAFPMPVPPPVTIATLCLNKPGLKTLDAAILVYCEVRSLTCTGARRQNQSGRVLQFVSSLFSLASHHSKNRQNLYYHHQD